MNIWLILEEVVYNLAFSGPGDTLINAGKQESTVLQIKYLSLFQNPVDYVPLLEFNYVKR